MYLSDDILLEKKYGVVRPFKNGIYFEVSKW